MTSKRELRRRCERIVEQLDLPDPFDIEQLCRRLGAQRGRPIRLLPLRLPVNSPCGMWVSTAAFDAIFYETDTSPAHQILIIAHEIGHLLCEHAAPPVLDRDASRLLLPDLDPELVQRTLGRTNYSALEEREAETIATVLLRRACRPGEPAAANLPPDDAELYGRLRSLEHPDR